MKNFNYRWRRKLWCESKVCVMLKTYTIMLCVMCVVYYKISRYKRWWRVLMECNTCNRVIPKYSHFIMDADIPINAFQSSYTIYLCKETFNRQNG